VERRITVELRQGEDESPEDAVGRLAAVGARPVPGFVPVPMAGSPPSVCVTVVLEDAETERRIRSLPDLIRIWSDPEISHFGMGPSGNPRGG
jgi:hypothetical protein